MKNITKKTLQIDVDVDKMTCKIIDPCPFYIAETFEKDPQALGEFVGGVLDDLRGQKTPRFTFEVGQEARNIKDPTELNRILVRKYNVPIDQANDITCKGAKKFYKTYFKPFGK